MAVLVCGGAGYIGSHTVLELIDMGQNVIVVDNLEKGHKSAVGGAKLYIGDLRDSEFMKKVFTENEIERLLTLRHIPLWGKCFYPLAHYHNNVTSTICLLGYENTRIYCFLPPPQHTES